MRHFLKRKRGKLINVLGRGDTGAIPMQNAYSSSKVWIRNFTKVLAKEYKESGIEVMGFNPGLVRTEFLSSVQAVRGYETKLNPLRYVVMLWGNEVDVPAQKALWLASPATDGKNGLLVKMLTSGFMISRLITVPITRLLRNHNELMELNITPVESAISGDRF
jgi:NAD(P)-dependent dehydrogenase (short-subunit alcohol dehydrogenase family)